MNSIINYLRCQPENHTLMEKLEHAAKDMTKELKKLQQPELERITISFRTVFDQKGKRNIMNIISAQVQFKTALTLGRVLSLCKAQCQSGTQFEKKKWDKVIEIANIAWVIRLAAAEYGSPKELNKVFQDCTDLSSLIRGISADKPVEGLDQLCRLFFKHDLCIPLNSAKDALKSNPNYNDILTKYNQLP